TAQVLGPKGTITEPTPLIQWQPVDGVPYYHLLFSDSPVTIAEDENGETVVQGANIIWQAITSNTSIRYGDPDPSGYFQHTNGTTPPLVTGLIYNYIILNNYGNHPAFTSAVQGSVNEFVVNIPTTLTKPQLQAPADSAFLTGDEIVFRWDEVEGAVNYKISIFEQRTEDGSTVSYPVWETTTSNTLVDFPAGNYLINANYFWKVIAWDESGGGVQSPNSNFVYSTSVGTMYIRTLSSAGQLLTRVEVEVSPVEGSSDNIPIITNDNATFRKTLRDGTYDLTAHKEGYEDESVRVVLPVDPYPNSTDGDYQVDILLEESPGSIAGRVYNPANGTGIAGAEVTATHTASGEMRTATSDADGNFLLGVQSGDWEVSAQKTGYVKPQSQTVKVDPGMSIHLGQNAIAMELSAGTLIGVIRTTTGNTLQGAVIRVYNATDSVTATSASNGAYQATLASGRWTVNTEKAGYVSPQPASVSISHNGVTALDLSLTPRANVISGYVDDGNRTIAGATITAAPLAGSPVSTTTNNLGQYSLSLGSGTFALSAGKSGYDGGDAVQITVTVGETVARVNFTMTPNPSSINGRVTSDGINGVAGARVTNGSVSATANSSGAFTLSLPAGAHEIYAEKTGYAAAEKQTISLAPGQSLAEFDFQLAPNAATISGAVTGSGLALFQAIVLASGASGDFETQTDAQGAFSISLPPGAYSLLAKRDGYLNASPKSITANPGQILTGVDFALVLNKATVSGIVKSASGEFLRNAIVTAIDDSNAANSSTSTTNISGEFTMKLTAGASYKLKAAKDNYSNSLADLGRLAAGAQVFEDFTLTALPGSISGTVRDQSANPLAGANVYIERDTVVTDHLGAFTFYLSTGTHQLGVQKPGYGVAEKTITLTPG
ncbi:MAG: carboxypeptidase regulatory-like domain-containing protein, partial [bacterium]